MFLEQVSAGLNWYFPGCLDDRQARQRILEGHDPLNNCEAEGIWYQCQIPREMYSKRE